MAPDIQRREILDWYHLSENLEKVGGSMQRLNKAKALLWKGDVNATAALFEACKRKRDMLPPVLAASKSSPSIKRRAS